MEKDTIVLADLVDEVETEIVSAKKAEARRLIHAIFGDILRWDLDIASKQREIEVLVGKRRGAIEKIDKLRNGDWSVLPKAPRRDEQAEKRSEQN